MDCETSLRGSGCQRLQLERAVFHRLGRRLRISWVLREGFDGVGNWLSGRPDEPVAAAIGQPGSHELDEWVGVIADDRAIEPRL